MTKIYVGVSSYLLGNKVRYDSEHKRDYFVASTLKKYFEVVSICPEIKIGLGLIRTPICLVGSEHSYRAVITNSNDDVTAGLEKFADKKIQTIRQLSGYVLKKYYPSCGMERVKVYDQNNVPSGADVGTCAGIDSAFSSAANRGRGPFKRSITA